MLNCILHFSQLSCLANVNLEKHFDFTEIVSVFCNLQDRENVLKDYTHFVFLHKLKK